MGGRLKFMVKGGWSGYDADGSENGVSGKRRV